MKTRELILLLLIVFVGCAQSKTIDITEISQKDLNSGIVIDVRTPEEFNAGHLDKARNINWYDENFAEQFNAISKEETLYVYCKKGGRSAKAQEKLTALGFTHVVNLEGGYDAYIAAKSELVHLFGTTN